MDMKRSAEWGHIRVKDAARASDKQQIMSTLLTSWSLLVPLAAVLSWAAARWWYGRKLRRLESRLGKLAADRETLQEQVKRARQQLAQVQKDLSTWRLAVANAQHGKAAAPAAEPAPASAPATPDSIKARLDIPSGLVFEAPPTAANGFADTQPFEADALS
jgi:hypothetical protein